MVSWSLNSIISDEKYSHPLSIGDVGSEILTDFLKKMVRIRLVEQKLATERKVGKIGGPVHLGIGQEAVAVAISAHLRNSDRVFGAHRSHAQVLALGADLVPFFSEILGKEAGLSRGMGGSMHLQDLENGFYGSVPIVAGSVPLAAGAALAAKMDKSGDVGVACLGDGAMEEGVVHETMNFVSAHNVPVIFVVENNMFASHLHISERQPMMATSRFAEANAIKYHLVDGNDVLAVSEAMADLVASARTESRPGFLEAITYRWLGHVDWREDIDVGVNRSAEDLRAWKKRDPVARLDAAMIDSKIHDLGWRSDFEKLTMQEIEEAWDASCKGPFPEPGATLSRVYSDGAP
ncbi:thiamine pyrophosphate-dependent dehydrogenase E1 component subunit alpha [Alphaproteobacteria bacterium]|nr:thiamine pyrophosphate-dependent dehydrogenase E1 component subunit alpha [Alphaproteobacteria bacterium]